MSFSSLRQTMVQCQLLPVVQLSETLKKAAMTVPREKAVLSHQQSLAYSDAHLDLGQGRTLMNPMAMFRLMALLGSKPLEHVLDVGCGFGYSTALLAYLSKKVTAIEMSQNFMSKAQVFLEDLGSKATLVLGDLLTGCLSRAPYDAIVIQGAIEAFPEKLYEQLSQGGTMVFYKKIPRTNLCQAHCVTKTSHGPTSRKMFEGSAPGLERDF